MNGTQFTMTGISPLTHEVHTNKPCTLPHSTVAGRWCQTTDFDVDPRTAKKLLSSNRLIREFARKFSLFVIQKEASHSA